ncbi:MULTISPECIES: hypothetical protein [Streptomyces]|uniref:Uncharacterized protein n=1 Tax=Streptomyces tsukubensis (strain DSM 42081 / NBRC 108919 / NRRL 18488 / 9993) TaxID=1114943 RepID=I2N5R0_STRT9|nr:MULTISPECIES: hypothetical protein [Streptomyces]AZK96368.1 hypothetical protein B7R87_22695 [Streptomyces tsukubensis]EIF92357.1 hypothetical protein [Streptomyces tsukubensis NRRL18488]MYS63101.1 hypothetical protein [Streptomyces sp. SID5473]QKM67625.1 hypothetical protein STSU_011100 [Streptomyces tsukubensis NRRL18488]TAI44022.1 hypothetical protein EWI31_10900 [Streptomyces tsukubensis]
MAVVDPSDPEAFAAYEGRESGEEEDAAGTGAPSGGAGTANRPDEEVPEADAAEQRTEVRPEHDDPPRIDRDRANEADAVEQARAAGQDEDDYR